ncbi:MAG: hypothetical protein JWO88_3260, partial [Frankiales bacterium]|nr:hypothetical protein [Frankiales bacterium]
IGDNRWVRNEVRELSRLLDEWDPIGVYDPPEDGPPPGEYARLVGPLLTKLRTGGSAHDIAEYLSWDARTNMGLGGQPGADVQAAERIFAWFHSQSSA